MSLRLPISKTLSNQYETIDVLLHDGSVIENLAIDASGVILGKVVGGQDGLNESPQPFKQEDIAAYRFRAGLKARLGMAQWQQMEQRSHIT